MHQNSETRRLAYLTALSQEIHKKLLQAESSPSQQLNLLQGLFADIALEVDDRSKDVILSRVSDVIAPVENEPKNRLCFYDVLSEHFIQVPEDGQPILDLIVKLWSQSFASHIFALLFHKWLFEVKVEDSEKMLRYCSAVVQGSANIFWMDVQANSKQFQSLFYYLFEDVALDQSRLTKLVIQGQRDLFLLISRFLFFYNAADQLESFLHHFPPFPTSFLVGGPADIFVIEFTDQLQKLMVEPVLLHYLSQIEILKGLDLRMTTSTRLKTCLYSFTSPGGPTFPTRTVRHAARDALDELFPVGQYPRHFISLFFRLLYPWYWPSSCWHFLLACIKVVFYSLLGLIISSWEKLRRPGTSKRDM